MAPTNAEFIRAMCEEFLITSLGGCELFIALVN
jgi:hypothetical protein